MAAGRAPLNYSTTIDPVKSAGECMTRLASQGASAISMTYDAGFPTGLSFKITTPWGPRAFALPVNVDGTFRALERAKRKGDIRPGYVTREQAQRVAWRVLKDWLEAQLALIDAGVAELSEVMLPWVQVEPGKTLYQAYAEQQPALEAGGSGD